MRQEICSHTGLRGLAALLVVAYHQQFTAGYRLPVETTTLLFERSYLMVDLFFILSGFVLSYVYAEKLDVRSFFRARFARIYPLHVFALLCLTAFTLALWAAMTVTGHEPLNLGTFGDWFRQLVLLNAWVPTHSEWNVPSWSISAEVFAYLLFPVALSTFAAQRRLAQAIIVAFAIAFYSLIGRSLDIVAVFAPLRCLAGFGLGMVLFSYRNVRVRWRSALQLAAAAWIALALALPVADALIIPAFAAVVLLTWQDCGILSRILSTRPLHWLGKTSYSIYLMHVPIGAVIWFLWSYANLPVDGPISRCSYLAITFATVLCFSHLSYNHVERPCQELLRRRRAMPLETAIAAP